MIDGRRIKLERYSQLGSAALFSLCVSSKPGLLSSRTRSAFWSRHRRSHIPTGLLASSVSRSFRLGQPHEREANKIAPKGHIHHAASRTPFPSPLSYHSD